MENKVSSLGSSENLGKAAEASSVYVKNKRGRVTKRKRRLKGGDLSGSGLEGQFAGE